ncbi:protein E8 [Elephant endotheliotropic herpesvirus 5B]|nr:protein E8 [Elephant endotheliotropic herpesvirus 5B]
MTPEGHHTNNTSIHVDIQNYIDLVNSQEIPGIGPDICCFYFLAIFALSLLLVAILFLREDKRERRWCTILDPSLCVAFTTLMYYKLFVDRFIASGKSYNWLSDKEVQFITVFKRIYLSVLCFLSTAVAVLYSYTKLNFNVENVIVHTATRVISRRFVPVMALTILNLDFYSLQSHYYVPSFMNTHTFGFHETKIYLTAVSPSICIEKAMDFLLYVILVIAVCEAADHLNIVNLTHLPIVFFFCCFTIYSFVQNKYVVESEDSSMYMTLEVNIFSAVIYLFTKILLMY